MAPYAPTAAPNKPPTKPLTESTCYLVNVGIWSHKHRGEKHSMVFLEHAPPAPPCSCNGLATAMDTRYTTRHPTSLHGNPPPSKLLRVSRFLCANK